MIHPESHGNSDLVAHFFRRAFNLLKPGGCFGLIATNTIGQGDTRSTGLRWICGNGGGIFPAPTPHKWPGPAAGGGRAPAPGQRHPLRPPPPPTPPPLPPPSTPLPP